MRSFFFLLSAALLAPVCMCSSPLEAVDQQSLHALAQQQPQLLSIVQPVIVNVQKLNLAAQVVSLRWSGKNYVSTSHGNEAWVEAVIWQSDDTKQLHENGSEPLTLTPKDLIEESDRNKNLPAANTNTHGEDSNITFKSSDLEEFTNSGISNSLSQDLNWESLNQSVSEQLSDAQSINDRGADPFENRTEVAPGGGEHWLEDPTSAWW